MITIVFDTNFLVSCAKQKIPLREEFERIFLKFMMITTIQVTKELENIAEKGKIKDRNAANLALQLLKHEKVVIKKIIGENADDALLQFDKKGFFIATLDKILKKRFKNARLLTIRQRRYIYPQ